MLKVFEYQEQHRITFDFSGNEIMINATEMARTFGKQPVHFLRNTSIKDYISVLCNRYANSHSETTDSQFGKNRSYPPNIVRVVNGGQNYGTWFHRKLALRFAQWLSPEFALWVDEQIEELLTKGRVSLSNPADPILMLRTIADALEASRKETGQIKQDVLLLNTEVTKVKAKVENINTDYYALSGYYVLRGRRFDLTKVEAQQYGKKLTKASALNGHIVRKTYHEKYGSVNTYHVDVLKAVLGF